MLIAECHCGQVVIEISRTPESLTECNCSICRRYAARWAYYTRSEAWLRSGKGQLSAYQWSDRSIEFFHCRNCGCVTHYESVDKQPDSRFAVNARMLPAAIVRGIPVKYFDGASSWEFIESKDFY